MRVLKKYLPFLTSLLVGFSSIGTTEELVVKAPNGRSFIMEIVPQDSFETVMNQIDTMIICAAEERDDNFVFPDEIDDDACPCDNLRQEFCVDFSLAGISVIQASATANPRNFNAPVSPQEKSDIRHIVTTLAKSSLVSLMRQKGDLERTGNRINHVHPLRFLMTVFTDEELKVGIRNIRPRGWVWSDFIKGLRESLSEEAGRGNITNEQVQAFAAAVGVNPAQILPYIQSYQWDALVDTLISIVPRQGGNNRYDM